MIKGSVKLIVNLEKKKIVLKMCSQVFALTHLSLLDYSILIYWMGLFSIIGVAGLLFHFDRNFCCGVWSGSALFA